ncbi:MAG: hypothetical protein ACFFD4_25355 [Candidatus Odinarchaeota archaeon]
MSQQSLPARQERFLIHGGGVYQKAHSQDVSKKAARYVILFLLAWVVSEEKQLFFLSAYFTMIL